MDNIELKKLRMLVESEYWNSVEPFSELLFKKWSTFQIKQDDEFNTVWNMATHLGKIEGVKEFIRSIEEISHE